MAESDDIDHDAGYNELTLLEKRNRNIERNKTFFLSLFGSSISKSVESSESATVVDSVNTTSHKVARFQLDSFICDEEKKREDIVTSLSAYYPHRRGVIQRLVGYLHPVSFRITVHWRYDAMRSFCFLQLFLSWHLIGRIKAREVVSHLW